MYKKIKFILLLIGICSSLYYAAVPSYAAAIENIPTEPTVANTNNETSTPTDSIDESVPANITNTTNITEPSNAETDIKHIISIPQKLKIPVGNEVTIPITFLQEDTFDESMELKWKSSNKKVASVDDNGVVTAKKAGKSRITLTCGDASLTCKVTVPKVKLSLKKKLTIPYGVTMTMPLTVRPAGTKIKNTRWSSSNSKIVKVTKSGKATAQRPGKCTIYARSKYRKKKLTCKVTVPKVKIRNVKSSVRVPYSSGTRFIQPKFHPAGSVLTIKSVRSTRESVATAYYINGVDGYCLIGITPKKSGNTTVYVKFSNGTEKKIRVRVPALSLKDQIAQQNYQITSSSLDYTEEGSTTDITISNLSSRKISRADYTLIQYDINGNAISTTQHSIEEKIRSSDSYTETVLLNENTFYTRCCISKIQYTSGQRVKNPLYKKWMKKYKKHYNA